MLPGLPDRPTTPRHGGPARPVAVTCPGRRGPAGPAGPAHQRPAIAQDAIADLGSVVGREAGHRHILPVVVAHYDPRPAPGRAVDPAMARSCPFRCHYLCSKLCVSPGSPLPPTRVARLVRREPQMSINPDATEERPRVGPH